jgi:hypothetical protein
MSTDTGGGERPLTPPEPTGSDLADPDYRAAVVDLLGALAYGELRAFSQLAVDAEMAPTLTDRSALALHAAQEIAHYRLLAERLTSLGAGPEEAMAPFVAPVDAFHDRTRPSGWLEGLVKVYVGEGIAQDFYREVAAYVDSDTRDLVIRVLDDTGRGDFVVTAVRAAIAADERVAGRLALWARRLVGEAISQAQHVAVERDALAGLLIGAPDRPGADLAELGRLFVRLTDEHTLRMARLGLSA